VVGRLWLRRTGLPDWAPQLSERERGAIHHIERALYRKRPPPTALRLGARIG
jgi:hypothetical protein